MAKIRKPDFSHKLAGRSPASGSRTRPHAFVHCKLCPSHLRPTSPKYPRPNRANGRSWLLETLEDAIALTSTAVRRPTVSSRRNQPADLELRVEPQQCESQRVIKRSSVAQPQMRRATSQDRGLAEVVNSIGRRRLAVVGDDRRMRVEISDAIT